ncbi:CcdB family protein [Limnohabitans sp.]|uniref:CcdB family protein n=1 Tax=Limnohabitans sp. TaxID=1907725 RepID=UPI00286F9F25|nr:CcdB family protein [Limnohabitans sp.]
MAQFDVYANPSESAAHGIPYVVVVQSDLLEALATRMVMPLATMKFAGKSPDKLCPLVIVNGQRLRALAHYTAPLPTRSLRQIVGNVAVHASELIAAMDVIVAGI